MKLPESLYFLRPGWWAVHLASIAAVFVVGFFAGHHLAGHEEHSAHAGHHAAGDHEHTSPEVLRPLMQQLLADSVQLQGALSAGDLSRAASHAAAIASACEDSDSEHGSLPSRLGPSFLVHDRDLHGSASRLAQALRAGRRDEARDLSRGLLSTCESCHAQAPAASGVDLRVLTSFAALQADPEGGAP